jgi:hypothetical protein
MDLTITREKFNNFLRSIKIMENACTDCDIVNGKVRQKTNSGHCIIEMDLNDIFTANCNFTISQLKQKINLLKIFEKDDAAGQGGQDDNVLYKDNDTTYIIADNISEITFRKPLKKFLDNVYIDDNEIVKKLNASDEDLLFEHTISANVGKRIKNVCEGFFNDVICCKVRNSQAGFYIATTNNEQYSDVVKGIVLNKVESDDYDFNIQSFAFTLESGDIKLKVYRKGKVLLWKFYQTIFNIPVIISGRSDVQPIKKVEAVSEPEKKTAMNLNI